MGQQQSNSNDRSRRRSFNQVDGFVTESSGKVAEKYKIDVSRSLVLIQQQREYKNIKCSDVKRG